MAITDAVAIDRRSAAIGSEGGQSAAIITDSSHTAAIVTGGGCAVDIVVYGGRAVDNNVCSSHRTCRSQWWWSYNSYHNSMLYDKP